MLGLVLLSACAAPTAAPTATPAPAGGADLSGVKTYLVNESDALHITAVQIKAASDSYYALAKTANFDYGALWASKPDQVRQVIGQAAACLLPPTRSMRAWRALSPAPPA